MLVLLGNDRDPPVDHHHDHHHDDLGHQVKGKLPSMYPSGPARDVIINVSPPHVVTRAPGQDNSGKQQ